MKLFLSFVLLVFVVCGCSEKQANAQLKTVPQEQPAPVQPDIVVTDEVEGGMVSEEQDPWLIVDSLLMDGDVQSAVIALEAMLDDEAYVAERPWLFNKLLSVIAENEGIEAAQQRYLSVFDKDEPDTDLIRGGFDVIYGHLNSTGDWDGILSWSKMMAEFDLPEELVARNFQWQLQAYQALDDIDALLASIPVCMDTFDPRTAVRMLTSTIRSAIGAQKYDQVFKILDSIDEHCEEESTFATFSKVVNLETLFLDGQWAEGMKTFKTQAAGIDDNELRTVFAKVMSRMLAADKVAQARDLSLFVISDLQDKPETHKRAAVYLMTALAKKADNISDVIPDFDILIENNVAPNTLFALCNTHFYSIIREGKEDDHKKIIAVCEKIVPLLKDEKQAGQMKLMIFDGVFFLKDYDRAEAMLASGIPEQEPGWNEMADNKLKAHKALDEGNLQEAVERFRTFMDYVTANWEEPVYDPLSGLLHSKNMSLGFNARRIGDILTDMGDTDGAAKAYAEALEYYKQALDETKPSAKENEYIKEILKELSE